MVDQAIDGGQRHGLVGKDLVPFAEGLVGGDQQGSALVAGTDQFEQHAGLGLILGDIGEVVADQQMIFVEFGEGGFEVEVASGQLELLDEIGGAGKQHAPAVLDQGHAEGRCQMALSPAGRAEHDDVCPLLQPGVASGQCHDLGLADHGHGVEIEAFQGLARGQAGLVEVACDPAPGPLGDLVFGESGEEARRRPPFLVGAAGEVGQQGFDGGQPEVAQDQAEGGSLEGDQAR